MRNGLAYEIIGVITAFLVGCVGVFASPVSLERREGQAFAFRFADTCYLLMPSHVHEPFARIKISSLKSPRSFQAEIIIPRVDGKDLSIGRVTDQDYLALCTTGWNQMLAGKDERVLLGDQIRLERDFSPSSMEAVSTSVVSVGAFHFEVRGAKSDMSITPGWSGAAAYSSDGKYRGYVYEMRPNGRVLVMPFSSFYDEVAEALRLPATVLPECEGELCPKALSPTISPQTEAAPPVAYGGDPSQILKPVFRREQE